MKKILLLSLMLISLTCAHARKRVTIKGVQYEVLTDATAQAVLTVMAKNEVSVHEIVSISKSDYKVVQLAEANFSRNKSITSVVLPKSLQTIKTGAFKNCVNLRRVVLPTGSYTVEQKAFDGCRNITQVEGNTLPYDQYVLESGTQQNSTASKPLSGRQLFSSYANEKLKRRMEQWQKKKEYETVEQYRQRVTDEKRQERMNGFIEDLKDEYATMYAPKSISTRLLNYDDEYNVFTIQTYQFGNIYAKVPKSEASEFRSKYKKVQVEPKFGVNADTLYIASCQFKLGNKTYDSATNYSGFSGQDAQFELPPFDVNLAVSEGGQPTEAVDNTIDINIPQTKQQNDRTFAIVIGNEDYNRVAEVPYAINDARIFAEYCKKTLGVPVQNVRFYENATFGAMLSAMNDIKSIAEAYEGRLNVIFYYAGHGVPNETNHDAFLLPVDADGRQTEACYSLDRLYKELGALRANQVVVFIDACFSGALRGDGMLASARGVEIEAAIPQPESGSMVVFTAAQGKETAFPYKEKGHGLFTYYLLKKLKDTQGNCTLSELGEYIKTNVKQKSVVINRKSQTPNVLSSDALNRTWRSLKLR